MVIFILKLISLMLTLLSVTHSFRPVLSYSHIQKHQGVCIRVAWPGLLQVTEQEALFTKSSSHLLDYS